MATLTDDCETSLPNGDSWKGQTGVREFYAFFLSAFENMVWTPQAVVIGPQGVLDVAEMTGIQQKTFGGLERLNTPVRVQWVIFWSWDLQRKQFGGEKVYSLSYLPL